MVFNVTLNNVSVIYIVVVCFISGGNRSSSGKPPFCRKSL